MRESEAAALVALLAAYFPAGADLSSATVSVYANELLPFEREIGTAVVHRIGTTARFFPPLADLIAEMRSERERRMPTPALPQGDGISFAEFLEAHPEVRSQIEAIGGGER